MSTICSCVILYAFLVLSAWQDERHGRISAGIAAAAFLSGMLVVCTEGWAEAAWYVFRFSLFAAPFFLFFLLGMTGGGDWKLFGLVGALGGWPYAVYTVGIALFAAGICSMIRMMYNSRLRTRLRIFIWYCRRCTLDRTLYRYPVVADTRDELRLGIFVLLGAVLAHLYMLWGWIVCN